MHALTDRRTPRLDAVAINLDERGAFALWRDEAAAFRQHVGAVAGWVGTARMMAAMGATALQGQLAKHEYQLQRPFQLDSTIAPLGPIPHDTSYPSGHSAASAAAATVLAHLWPERSARYEQLVRSVEWARVYSGVHFPSDVTAGDALGRAVGEQFA